MEKEEILSQLNKIFKEELDNEDIVLSYESNGDDIEEWDSLSHIHLVVAVEKHFKVKFTTVEIMSLKNIGDMCNSVKQKLG